MKRKEMRETDERERERALEANTVRSAFCVCVRSNMSTKPFFP